MMKLTPLRFRDRFGTETVVHKLRCNTYCVLSQNSNSYLQVAVVVAAVILIIEVIIVVVVVVVVVFHYIVILGARTKHHFHANEWHATPTTTIL